MHEMAHDEHFEALRGYLFALSYRMLGSVADAEDVVQEAYLRWQRTSDPVDSPKAFLSTVTTRLCIDHLRSAKSKREAYVGPWLPEPLGVDDSEGDPAHSAEQADSLSMAFLTVLETLTPVERAVFLLREVFEYGYDEIADIVGRTETNCRQLTHRAKEHIASRRPRFEASREKREELTARFLVASAAGDMEGLMELLTEDITLWSDGGGVVRAARRPIYGRSKVARFLVNVVKKAPAGVSSEIAWVNGRRAVVLHERGRLTTVLTLDVADEGIQGVHIVVNPDKLTRLSAPSS